MAEKLARFKRNSLRETRLTISPIPETSLFPSGIRCYCQTIFPFSNESPLYSCFSPLLFVILFSFQTINFHEGKNKRGNTSLRNSRYRLRFGNDLGRIPALTKIRSSSRRKIHPQPVKEKPVPRLFIGGSIVVPFVLSFPPIYTVRSRETHDCPQHFRHRR